MFQAVQYTNQIKTKFIVTGDKKEERAQLLAEGKTAEAAAVKIEETDFAAELKPLLATLPAFKEANREFSRGLTASLERAPVLPTPELVARMERLKQLTRDYLATRRLVGLVPQEVNFDPFFTVEELLKFQAGYFGVPITDGRLSELLAAMGLTDKRKSNSRALSGGMKRRLLIAKALVHDPKVLFLDEPTSGVDPVTRREFWSHINGLVERGVTVMVTGMKAP